MAVTVAKHKNLIGGKWVDAADGQTMEVLNPSTGEVIAEVPRCSAEDAERAIDAAGDAWDEWRNEDAEGPDGAPARARRRHGGERRGAVAARVPERRQAGRRSPWTRSPSRSTTSASSPARRATSRGSPPAEYVEGYTSIVRREPLGIVAGITPWNYPLMMMVWKLGPALAAGNVQILKPAEQTPLTTLRFFELAQEVVPPGVVQVITGDGVPVGDMLVRHPEVRLVSLTGDVETGKTIARNAADNLKRVHLELGGKAPMVVLDDADPATVAEAIKIGGYWNTGQDCTASSRIIVHEGVYDDVLSESVKAVEAMKVADPAEGEDVDMGPLISEEQRERVLGFLERAVDAKATVVTGGGTVGDRGFFVQPTVVTDVEQDSEIVQKEVFGPVVTMQRFSSDDEAIAMANGVRYGLAASVFSESVGRALKVAAKLDFGTVWVNEHLFPLTSEMPHGGFKESGYGKDMSIYSMEEYTRIKHVAVKLA